MPVLIPDPVRWETATKLYSTCVDICVRHGVSADVGLDILRVDDDVLRSIGSMLIRGIPEQVVPTLPDECAVRVALAGGYAIGVLDLGAADSWYLRVASPDKKFFIGMVGGEIALAQVFTTSVANLSDTQAAALESHFEGL